jgi:hypothetical protein
LRRWRQLTVWIAAGPATASQTDRAEAPGSATCGGMQEARPAQAPAPSLAAQTSTATSTRPAKAPTHRHQQGQTRLPPVAAYAQVPCQVATELLFWRARTQA